RGTFTDRLDPRLSVILGVSVIAHFAIVIIALTMDVELDSGISGRAYNLTFTQEEYQVELEQPKIELPQEQGDQGSAAEEQKPAEEKKPATVPDIKKPSEPAGGGGRDPMADVQRQEENARAMADLLTGEGPGEIGRAHV